jgi:hypothetical protein
LTELFVAALVERTRGPVQLIAYVDFDAGGWVGGHAFAQQLRRYGVESSEPLFLVRPERFTAEEIALYAIPIPTPTPQIEGKVKAWLAQSGGVNGRAMGIHADHLRPVDRVLAALRELLLGADHHP